MLRSDAKGPDDKAVSPAKAARVSLARAADQAFGLALRVNSIRQSRLDLADVVDQIEEDWALFPLLHDDGSVGVMCLEAACIIAFVETQTMGRVNVEAAAPRRLTQTDKALAVSFLEGFLRQFDEALIGAPTAYWTRGYRAEDAVTTRHMMVLQLDGAEYRGFNMQSDVVEADRSVSMRLFLPIKEKQPNLAARKKTKDGKGGNDVRGQTIRRSALAASVEMDAIMCKIMVPLSELSDLKPGHLVPLPQDAAQQAQLVDRSGRSAQTVRLGQLHGMRAVRLVHEKGSSTAQNIAPFDTEETEPPNSDQARVPAQPDAEPALDIPQEPQAREPQAEQKDELDMLLEGSSP